MSQVTTFHVNGEELCFDFSDLEIIDMEDLRSKSAASIAYWSAVVADAERDLEYAEAEYDSWHGKAMSLALKASAAAATSEWKIKAAIAAQPDALHKAKEVADVRNNVARAKAVLIGFQKQHDLLKAMTVSSGSDLSRAADIGRTGDNRMAKFKEARAKRTQTTGNGE